VKNAQDNQGRQLAPAPGSLPAWVILQCCCATSTSWQCMADLSLQHYVTHTPSRQLRTCTPASLQQVLRYLRRLPAASLADNDGDSVALDQVQELPPAHRPQQSASATSTSVLLSAGVLHTTDTHTASTQQVSRCWLHERACTHTEIDSKGLKAQSTVYTLLHKSQAHMQQGRPVLVDRQPAALVGKRQAFIRVVHHSLRIVCSIAAVSGKGHAKCARLTLARPQKCGHDTSVPACGYMPEACQC